MTATTMPATFALDNGVPKKTVVAAITQTRRHTFSTACEAVSTRESTMKLNWLYAVYIRPFKPTTLTKVAMLKLSVDKAVTPASGLLMHSQRQEHDEAHPRDVEEQAYVAAGGRDRVEFLLQLLCIDRSGAEAKVGGQRGREGAEAAGGLAGRGHRDTDDDGQQGRVCHGALTLAEEREREHHRRNRLARLHGLNEGGARHREGQVGEEEAQRVGGRDPAQHRGRAPPADLERHPWAAITAPATMVAVKNWAEHNVRGTFKDCMANFEVVMANIDVEYHMATRRNVAKLHLPVATAGAFGETDIARL
eukprot:CAMPEP_0176231546 /NCGR_PEP_ID=MMETSP0121_2-20121125/24853_1 /TAXON_ID=160619 /ORGANISM="Kryptoperidinium foliaceum, Strain CCMP 1326" /LENGTH=306 /DNA_ID=CAMNT_0017570889 /DNA_START=115 /DNA_END=1032 /DNA_ORIENTATION=+